MLFRSVTLKGHSERIISVGFSLDGTRIVSGSSDNTLKLWDAPRSADHPISKALSARSAAPKPRWHEQQAQTATEASDWYAATFHLAWLYRTAATSDWVAARKSEFFDQLREAYSKTTEAQRVTLKPLVQKAISEAKAN